MTSDELHDTEGSPPWKLEIRSSKAFVITVVAIAVFTDIFIYGMIVPILPTVLKTRVDIPDDQLQTWMSILLAAFGGGVLVVSPVFGYFADKGASRKMPFILGLLALGGATVMFWFARDAASMVIARVLQGLSGAAVWTVGLALIVDTVGRDAAGVAMGYVSIAMTVGIVSGPFIGGIVLSKAGYHAVFAMAVGLVVLDIILRTGMIEQKTASKWLQKHPEGETEGLLGPDESRIQDDGAGDRPEEQAEPDDGGSASSGRAGSLPGVFRLLFSVNLLAVLLAGLVNAALGASFDTVLPLYVMKTFHWDPFRIGLCFIPLFIPSFFAPIVGKLVDRYGARGMAFLGFLFDLPVFLLLQLVKNNSAEHEALLYIFLFFAGVASNLSNVALMVVVTDVVKAVEKDCPGIFGEQGGTGQAYGFYNVAWSGGQVLGPLFAGYLMQMRGWATMVTVFGVMSGATAVILGVTGPRGVRFWRR